MALALVIVRCGISNNKNVWNGAYREAPGKYRDRPLHENQWCKPTHLCCSEKDTMNTARIFQSVKLIRRGQVLGFKIISYIGSDQLCSLGIPMRIQRKIKESSLLCSALQYWAQTNKFEPERLDSATDLLFGIFFCGDFPFTNCEPVPSTRAS